MKLSIWMFLVGVSSLSAWAAPADPALLGCWRSQQSQRVMADGSQVATNGDCTLEFLENGVFRSRCATAEGGTDSPMRFEVVAPGRLRTSPLVAPAGGGASEVRYRIAGAWLMIERDGVGPSPNDKSPAASQRPVAFRSVSVRMPVDGAACQPRGGQPQRLGNRQASSLDLRPPYGWKLWNFDAAMESRLARALGPKFLVGAFAPQDTPEGAMPRLHAVVMDDVSAGAEPVDAAGFAALQSRFLGQMPEPRVPCSAPGAACGLLRAPGFQVYAELVHVKGRAAVLNISTGDASEAMAEELRNAARAFADRLRADNPL